MAPSDSRAPQPPWPSTQSLPFRPQDVIQVSKKFLPGMAVGYSSSKLTLHVGDGFEFMKQNQDAFDVIITDSSDPMGERGLGRGPSGRRRPRVQRSLLLSCHLPPPTWSGGIRPLPRARSWLGPWRTVGPRPWLPRPRVPPASGHDGFSFSTKGSGAGAPGLHQPAWGPLRYWGSGSLSPSHAPSPCLVSEFHSPGFGSQLCSLAAVWVSVVG